MSSFHLVRCKMREKDRQARRIGRRDSIRSKAHAKQLELQAKNLRMLVECRAWADGQRQTNARPGSKKINRLVKSTDHRIERSVNLMKNLERLISASLLTFNEAEGHVDELKRQYYRRRPHSAKLFGQPPHGETVDAWSWHSSGGKRHEVWGLSKGTTNGAAQEAGERTLFSTHSGGAGVAGVPSRLPGQTIAPHIAGMKPRPPASGPSGRRRGGPKCGRVFHPQAWIGSGGHNKGQLGRAT